MMSYPAAHGQIPADIQNVTQSTGDRSVEQMQSGNLQYRDPHVIENMHTGGLQYNAGGRLHGDSPQFAEDLRSGGLQVHDPVAMRHDEEKKPPLLPTTFAQQISPPAELSAGGDLRDNRASKRICGLSRRIFWLLAALLALIVIGAVVGGVVGSQKRQSTINSSGSVTPAAQSTSTVTSSESTSMTSITAAASSTSAFSSSATSSTVSAQSTSSAAASSSTAQPTAAAGTFSSNTWYRLTNLYLGAGTSLDVVNDNGAASSGTLVMDTTGAYSGQYWQLVGPAAGPYYLRTEFLGTGMHLDVTPGATPTPHLAPASDDSGQKWSILSWGDGTYALENAYTGSSLRLDTYSDTHALFMGDGNHSGQHWDIVAIGPVGSG